MPAMQKNLQKKASRGSTPAAGISTLFFSCPICKSCRNGLQQGSDLEVNICKNLAKITSRQQHKKSLNKFTKRHIWKPNTSKNKFLA
jgi:hypothetical protein